MASFNQRRWGFGFKSAMAANTKLSKAMSEAVCHDVKCGMGQDASAVHNGIQPKTLRNWIQTNDLFATAYKKAKSQFEYDHLAIIREASINRYDAQDRLTRKGSWFAAAWLLERRLPEQYGLKWQGELSGRGGKPLMPDNVPKVDTGKFTRTQLEKLIVATDLLLKNPKITQPTNGNPIGSGDT